MDIKKFIKNIIERDNTNFLIRIYKDNKVIDSIWFNLTGLTKYLKGNEKRIELININLLLTKEVKDNED